MNNWYRFDFWLPAILIVFSLLMQVTRQISAPNVNRVLWIVIISAGFFPLVVNIALTPKHWKQIFLSLSVPRRILNVILALLLLGMFAALIYSGVPV